MYGVGLFIFNVSGSGCSYYKCPHGDIIDRHMEMFSLLLEAPPKLGVGCTLNPLLHRVAEEENTRHLLSIRL